jgi:hypothetical protein
VPGEPGSQVIGAGQEHGPGLADGPGAFAGGAAPGDHQRADRLDGAVPAPGRTAGPAGLRGPGGADRVERVGLALPAPVLPAGADCLDDPDAGCGDVAGQAGTVAAGSLDTGQGDGAQPAQPAQQAGVARRCGGEFREAEQPAEPIERSGDMGICVSIHAGIRGATGNGACFFYDSHSLLLSRRVVVIDTRPPCRGRVALDDLADVLARWPHDVGKQRPRERDPPLQPDYSPGKAAALGQTHVPVAGQG